MDELKPCPFCGGNSDIMASFGKGRFGYCYWLRVQCNICGCKTRSVAGDNEEPFFAPDSELAAREVVELWNNRKESCGSNG